MKYTGKVLVTGGAGFIGKVLIKELQHRGYEVTVLDTKEQPAEFTNVKYIQGDITNPARCVVACAGQDYVIHLAAKARIQESLYNPDPYFDMNVTGTKNMLTAAAAVRVKKFVFASSSSIYGNGPIPNHPYHKPDPINYYAMTKLFGEHLCKQYKIMFDLDWNALRFFTVYSEDQPGSPENGLMIGKFARMAKEGIPLTIHGDGEYTRDYVHITDVVNACIMSMESRVKSEVFNVGSGEAVTVNHVVEILREYAPDLQAENTPKPKGYAKETLSDNSKTAKLLGWKPMITIDEGLRQTFTELFK